MITLIKSYEQFIDKLNNKIKSDEASYYELLVTVVKNPQRYTGIFRLSNAKTKLIQNVTQSREIKFGDFMEDIVTEYIADMGYKNLDKNIGTDDEGNYLSADQVFLSKENKTVYLIEQKIRDDHDSTKKRGQYQNFRKKYSLLKEKYPDYIVDASMWFIDDSLVKNRNYYINEAKAEDIPNVEIHIYYGGTLFSELFDRIDVWNEICLYLEKNKRERSNELLLIPDFDSSIEMLNALRKLKSDEPNLYKKLISNSSKYVQLRKELFPTGKNLENV